MPKTLLDLIEDLYRRCKPDLRGRDIDGIFKKYKTKELELYNVLCQKYSERPNNEKLQRAIGDRAMPLPRATTLGKEMAEWIQWCSEMPLVFLSKRGTLKL